MEPPKAASSKRAKGKGKSKANLLSFDDEVEESEVLPVVRTRKKVVVDPVEEDSRAIVQKELLSRRRNGNESSTPQKKGGRNRIPAARKPVPNLYVPPTKVGTVLEKEIVSQGSGDWYSAKRRECSCVGSAKRYCACNPVEEGYGRGQGWKVERVVERTVTVSQKTRRSKAEVKLE